MSFAEATGTTHLTELKGIEYLQCLPLPVYLAIYRHVKNAARVTSNDRQSSLGNRLCSQCIVSEKQDPRKMLPHKHTGARVVIYSYMRWQLALLVIAAAIVTIVFVGITAANINGPYEYINICDYDVPQC